MITVKGLEKNGYLINNPIIVTTEIPDLYKLEVIVTNQDNGLTSGLLTYYANPLTGDVKFDLSKIAKALMDKPKDESVFTATALNTSQKFMINIRSEDVNGDTDDKEFRKVFIRGGRITNKTNLSLPAESNLSITNKIPYFNGYPIYDYNLNENFKITPSIFTDFTFDRLELINRNTCNGLYIKFLNQNGGYSFWLFDEVTNEIKATSLGYTNNISNTTDFGLDVTSDFVGVTKVPARYIEYMEQLIMSPDVYYFKNNQWEKVRSLGGTVPKNKDRKAYKITMTFELINNFEPSLL